MPGRRRIEWVSATGATNVFDYAKRRILKDLEDTERSIKLVVGSVTPDSQG
jgi:hypothetical protein